MFFLTDFHCPQTGPLGAGVLGDKGYDQTLQIWSLHRTSCLGGIVSASYIELINSPNLEKQLLYVN